MGLDDKLSAQGDKIRGTINEQVGKATGDEELEAKGVGEKVMGDLKHAGEKVKDAVKDVFDK